MHAKFFRVRKILRTQVFAGFAVFLFCVENYYFTELHFSKLQYNFSKLQNFSELHFSKLLFY